MNGPRWIKQWISDMAALNEQFRNDDGLVDFDALGREEYNFRVALITQKFGKSERAREIYRVAKIAYDSSVENGKKGGRPKKIPQDAPHGDASKSPTSCNPLTADGDTREGSQDMHHARKGGTLESGTSANLSVPKAPRSKAPTKPEPQKRTYGEFANVALSDEESAKLQAKLGPARFERGVEVLGAWKVNNPAKAARIKSDYACFTSWVIKRLDEEKAADAKSPKAFAASERDRMADIVRNEFPDVIEEFGL